MQLIVNLDSNEQRKSLVKTSYKIPSPTILLPNELSSPIRHSSPLDNHRKLMTNSTPQSFYLKTPEELIINSERLLPTSVSSLNLIRRISSEQISISNEDQLSSSINRFSSTEFNLSIRQSNLIFPSPTPPIPLKQSTEDLNALPSHENALHTSPFEITPHRKNQLEKKQVPERRKSMLFNRIFKEYESLWKMKFPLKILMSMAHRDDAQALKHRKPIDYHLFLSNKFSKNSLLKFDDRKIVHSLKPSSTEEDNRTFFPRILNTMRLTKPSEIPSPRRNKRKIRRQSSSLIKANLSPYLTNEKPFLTIYQAIPKCPHHQ